jgi:hypothetical protein
MPAGPAQGIRLFECMPSHVLAQEIETSAPTVPRCVIPKEVSTSFEQRSAIMASRALKVDVKKPVTSDPDARPDPTETVDETAISARAYQLWQERGCPIGSPEADWFRAEGELKNRTEQSKRPLS